MNTGEKIRALRKSKKMTQRELADNRISRNMLSLIENGRAKPSLDTLTYLAKKLCVPCGALFDDSDGAYSKVGTLKELEHLFTNGHYSECAELCRNTSGFDDGLGALCALSELRLGYEFYKKHMLTSALGHFEAAITACRGCGFALDSLSQSAHLMCSIITCATADDIPDILSSPEAYEKTLDGAQLYLFLNCLKNEALCESVKAARLLTGCYEKYISASIQLRKRNYSDAAALLEEIISDENAGFFVLFRAVSKAEKAYSELEDFKNAYRCSKIRLVLLDDYVK